MTKGKRTPSAARLKEESLPQSDDSIQVEIIEGPPTAEQRAAYHRFMQWYRSEIILRCAAEKGAEEKRKTLPKAHKKSKAKTKK